MLFGKFHIVIFKDRQGACRKIQIRGWLLLLLTIVGLAMLGGNFFLWTSYFGSMAMERNLAMSEKTVQEQKTQLLSLAEKLKGLERDLSRVRDFDSKLRVMINLEQGSPGGGSGQGNPAAMDFTKSYLPLYRQELLARKMHDFLRQLSTEARLEEIRQQEIVHALRSNQEILEATPSIWPAEGWVTSTFGWRTSPFTAKREFHKGLDISCPTGTPIYAPSKGVAIYSGRDSSYGLTLVLDHGNSIMTCYAHLQRVAIKSGQTVSRGELVGYAGSTGRSTGPHLHYEVRLSGVPVNPMRYILN